MQKPSRGRDRFEAEQEELDERVVHIARVAKVVKGGRRFAFRVVGVVGDRNGRVGIGVGKARGVPDAIRKALGRARSSMIEIPLVGTTVPHEVTGRCSGSRVLIRPASPGTGVIAGGGVRAVLEAAGVRDVLTKSLGSANIPNVVKATLDGLKQMRNTEEIAKARGLSEARVMPFWRRGQ